MSSKDRLDLKASMRMFVIVWIGILAFLAAKWGAGRSKRWLVLHYGHAGTATVYVRRGANNCRVEANYQPDPKIAYAPTVEIGGDPWPCRTPEADDRNVYTDVPLHFLRRPDWIVLDQEYAAPPMATPGQVGWMTGTVFFQIVLVPLTAAALAAIAHWGSRRFAWFRTFSAFLTKDRKWGPLE